MYSVHAIIAVVFRMSSLVSVAVKSHLQKGEEKEYPLSQKGQPP